MPIQRFDKFEVRVETGEFLKSGRTVRLQPQPFAILAALLERPGELVTREHLREKLWPSDTFVDFDKSLNIAVVKLRQCLGDSADKPRFIETLPRRGYRFIGTVEAFRQNEGSIATIEPQGGETASGSEQAFRAPLRTIREKPAETEGKHDTSTGGSDARKSSWTMRPYGWLALGSDRASHRGTLDRRAR